MAVAQFNLGIFLARYPIFTAFNAANPGALAAMFSEAGFYLNNSDCSIVQDVNKRLVLLNMLTAHIAFIGGALAADGQARPVGVLSSAGEGSVNATFENQQFDPGSPAWYQQSQYGAAFWQATAPYRSMVYSPRATSVPAPGLPVSVFVRRG